MKVLSFKFWILFVALASKGPLLLAASQSSHSEMKGDCTQALADQIGIKWSPEALKNLQSHSLGKRVIEAAVLSHPSPSVFYKGQHQLLVFLTRPSGLKVSYLLTLKSAYYYRESSSAEILSLRKATPETEAGHFYGLSINTEWGKRFLPFRFVLQGLKTEFDDYGLLEQEVVVPTNVIIKLYVKHQLFASEIADVINSATLTGAELVTYRREQKLVLQVARPLSAGLDTINLDEKKTESLTETEKWRVVLVPPTPDQPEFLLISFYRYIR